MTFPPRLLNQGETVVLSTRSHPKALIGPVLRGLFVLAAAIVLFILLGKMDSGLLRTILMWAVAVLAIGAIVAWLVWPLLVWLNTTYTFTNRRFVERTGVVAKEGRTIPLNRISGVDFEQGVIDRIFKCGTLVVSDASQGGRVELHDIPMIEKTQLRVSEELHRLTSGESRHEDGS